MLIIDDREPKWIVQALLEVVPDAKIEHLAYGDFEIIGPKIRVVIERKEINDLFHSLSDGRLWEQLKGVEKFEGYKRVILIEGSFERARKWGGGVTLARFTGTKVSILYGWDNIQQIYTEDDKETVDFLRRLNEKVGNGTDEVLPRALGIVKEKRSPNEELVDVLRGYDGIGEMKAVDLLTKFRTVEKTARASAKEMASVIGLRDAEHLYDSFRRPFALPKKKKVAKPKEVMQKPYKDSETTADEPNEAARAD